MTPTSRSARAWASNSAVESALSGRGLEHYEVSNYALPGATARHNVAYWRGVSYLGLGPSAVGCVYTAPGSAVRTRNLPAFEAYMLAAERDAGRVPDERESLDGETLVREGLMLGLRTSEGLDLARLAERAGVDPRIGRERAIAREVARGNLLDDGAVARIPAARWLLADDIVSRLF